MLTGELRSKIDGVWNAFWAGGIANPLEVIEQITYLLFMRGLDEAHTREENKANRLGKPIDRRIFPKGKDGIGKGGGVAYEDMRWSRLKNRDPGTMFEIVSEHVFPFLRNMAEADTAHATHMKGARFTIPTPALLAKVVDLLAEIPMEDRDTKGDLYEYMLSKIASAGQNGQFRTPRHIIALMVICDPACGTCGFLVAAGEYLRENHQGTSHGHVHIRPDDCSGILRDTCVAAERVLCVLRHQRRLFPGGVLLALVDLRSEWPGDPDRFRQRLGGGPAGARGWQYRLPSLSASGLRAAFADTSFRRWHARLP
jgi:HsdM N-terminal domain/N-6 DNA Methylase